MIVPAFIQKPTANPSLSDKDFQMKTFFPILTSFLFFSSGVSSILKDEETDKQPTQVYCDQRVNIFYKEDFTFCSKPQTIAAD